MGLENYGRILAVGDAAVERLGLRWDNLTLTPEEAVQAELPVLSERLAYAGAELVRLSEALRRVETNHIVLKTLFEQTIQSALDPQAKGTLTAQTAQIVAANPELQRTQDLLLQLEVERRALAAAYSSIDVLWKTTSRVLSARLAEPKERDSDSRY